MTDTAPERSGMDETRERHKDAIERFSANYEPDGPMGIPHLNIGIQGFGLNFQRDADNPEEDAEFREWLGIMLCVALANLVDEHTATLTAEVERCHERLEITHLWQVNAGEPDAEPVKVKIPMVERADTVDGISCRDATIDMVESHVTELTAELDALKVENGLLREALSKIRRTLLESTLMLSGEVNMTKMTLERQIRDALDRVNDIDNFLGRDA